VIIQGKTVSTGEIIALIGTFGGIIVAIILGFYKIHRGIVNDRVKLENRITKIECELKKYRIFYDTIEKVITDRFGVAVRRKLKGKRK